MYMLIDASQRGAFSGCKMKYVSLKPNPYHIDVLGFTGYNDPKFIIDFIEEYCILVGIIVKIHVVL